MDGPAAASLLNLAERAGPGLKGLDSKALLAQLEQHYGDLLAAMRWFIDQERTDETIRLATALAPFWMATLIAEHGAERVDVVHRHDAPRFERVSWLFADQLVANTLAHRGWWRNLPGWNTGWCRASIARASIAGRVRRSSTRRRNLAPAG